MSSAALGRVAIVTLLMCGVAATARAQDDRQAAAEKKNAEGKQRMQVLDLEGAVRAFREAIAIDPDPRYYFNLCFTLNKLDRLAEAAIACEVTASSPGVSDALRDKARALEADINRRRAGGRVERPTDKDSETLADGEEAPGNLADGEEAPGNLAATEDSPADVTSPDPVEPSAQPASATTPPGPVVQGQSPPPPAKGLSLGATAGLSIATFDGSDAEAEAESQTGVRVGAILLAQLSSILAIETGLAFAQKGATAQVFVQGFGLVDFELDTSYLEVPVLLRASIPGLGMATPYAVAGPAVATLLSAKARVTGAGIPDDRMDVKEQYTGLDYALVSGVGVEFGTGTGAVVLDARFWLGLKDVVKADETTARIRSFALTAGFVF